MNDRDLRRSDRATRVQTFGRDNAFEFPADSKGAGLFTELDAILAALIQARVGQLRTPVAKQTLLDALFTDFKDIARTARGIALEDPAFLPAAFRFPADYSESTAITHAESLLKLLEGLGNATIQNKFIAFEIRPDFVEDLRGDLDALNERNSGKHSDNQQGVENTSAIDTLLGQAQSVITRLDAIIRNKYSSQPDKLLAWQSASHTERAAKKVMPAASIPTP